VCFNFLCYSEVSRLSQNSLWKTFEGNFCCLQLIHITVELHTVNVDNCHCYYVLNSQHTHPFSDPFPGLPRWASTRKVKLIWILRKQETVSVSGISWAICWIANNGDIMLNSHHQSPFLSKHCTEAVHWFAPLHNMHLSVQNKTILKFIQVNHQKQTANQKFTKGQNHWWPII